MNLDIQALDPRDESTLRAAYTTRTAAASVDCPGEAEPCWFQFRGQMSVPRSGFRQQISAIRKNDRILGGYRLELPQYENTDTAVLELLVHPDYRHTGAGRRLLSHAGDQTRRAGRERIVVDAESTLGEQRTGYTTFLVNAGAEPVLIGTSLRLDLNQAQVQAHDHLLKAALEASGDYQILHWVDQAPHPLQDGVFRLMSQIFSDSPSDSSDWEAAAWNADRSAANERLLRACRITRYTTAARSTKDGCLVGLTTLAFTTSCPEQAQQWETIVMPEHRGHRLGTRLKIENLRFALQHKRQAMAVHALNADSNLPMRAVNDALGFRPHRGWVRWELALS